MPHGSLHTAENVHRVRRAQLAAAAGVAIVCGYLLFSTVMTVHGTWSAQRLLHRQASESAALSRQVASESRLESRLPPSSSGGVDAFAVRFVRWAADRGIRVDSLVPEGSPVNAEVVQGSSKLGVWSTSKVRVKGAGDFVQLMALLDKIRDPGLPIQLASFALRTGQRGAVEFDLVFTVYEKKAEAA